MQQADLIQHSEISTVQVAILNLAQTEFTMKEGKLLVLFIFCFFVLTRNCNFFFDWNRCVNETGQAIKM